jgi:hypothetical protein
MICSSQKEDYLFKKNVKDESKNCWRTKMFKKISNFNFFSDMKGKKQLITLTPSANMTAACISKIGCRKKKKKTVLVSNR